MKKRTVILLIIVYLLLIFTLPLLISVLYQIGNKNAIIETVYSPSDMLNYIITVIGLTISIVALFLALFQFVPRIKAARLTSFNAADTPHEVLRVYNEGTGAITIDGIGLSSISRKKTDTIKINAMKFSFGGKKRSKRLYMTFVAQMDNELPKRIESREYYDFVLGNTGHLQEKFLKFAAELKKEGYKAEKAAYYISISSRKDIIYRSKTDDMYMCSQ